MVVLLVAIAVIALFLAVLANGLYFLRRQTQHAFGQIELQLKRRCDAVPRLIEVMKGVPGVEVDLLEKLSQTRSQALAAKTVIGKAAAENSLHRTIDRVFVLAQANPEVDSSEEMISIREEFRSTQNKIAFASQYYNDVGTTYNLRLETFPFSLVTAIGGFKPIDLFEFEGTVVREPAPARR